jgi:hypothetical protein
VLVETGIDGSRVEAQGSVDGRCKSPTRGSEKHNRAVWGLTCKPWTNKQRKI